MKFVNEDAFRRPDGYVDRPPDAGWYPEPDNASPPGFERWWTGAEWSDHTRQRSAGASMVGPSYVAAVLLTPVGLVMGMVLLFRGNRQGIGVILTGLAVALLLGALVAG